MRADELHDWRYLIKDNTLPVNERLRIARSIYDTAYERGKASADRPHGEWIYDVFDKNYHCSECNRVGATIYPFCPNCGSDNRGEGEAE